MLHHEIEIDQDDPFKNCALDRKKHAEILTQIVNVGKDGFVLSVNNKWGEGKTTFIKMWQKSLIKNKSIYFNAWENDFHDNVLLSFLAELKNILPEADESKYNTLLKNGSKIFTSIIPRVISAASGMIISSNNIKDIINAISESTSEIFENEVKEFISKKEGLYSFKKSLEDYVLNSCEEEPLIFIIDELDRCKPSYSVKLLELIKHFFNVKGIVFVLCIDKKELCASIRGFYGSEKLSAEDYLRRFIDLEYNIPFPDVKLYINHLIEYYRISTFFFLNNEIRTNKSGNEFRNLNDFFNTICNHKSLTLRQIDKLFINCKLVLSMFRNGSYFIPDVLILLIYLKEYEEEKFKSICNNRINYNELSLLFNNLFKDIINEENKKYYLAILAKFLVLYKNEYKHTHVESKLIQRSDNDNDIAFETTYFDKSSREILSDFIVNYCRDIETLSITYLITKVNLLESVQSY